MGKSHWPIVSSSPPDEFRSHAAKLHDEFEATAKHAHKQGRAAASDPYLPRSLKKKVAYGINKGLKESVGKGILPKDFSANQRSALSDIVLENIAQKASSLALDYVPLDQFIALLDSYCELMTRLRTQPTLRKETLPLTPPTLELSHESSMYEEDDIGLDDEVDAESLLESLERAANNGAVLRIELRHMMEESGRLDGLEAIDSEVGEGLREVEDSQAEETVEEEDADEEMEEADEDEVDTGINGFEQGNGAQWTQNEVKSLVKAVRDHHKTLKKETRRAGLEEYRPDASDVDRDSDQDISDMDVLDWQTVSDRVGGSRTYEQCHAKWIDLKAEKNWSNSHSPRGSYRVETAPLPTLRTVMSFAKQRSSMIEELVTANLGHWPSLRQGNDIINVNRGGGASKNKIRLVLVFSDARLANEALGNGILWHGKLYACEAADNGVLTLRCSNCQAFGQLKPGCRAHFQCGKCAQSHYTNNCTSPTLKCANCGNAHAAGSRTCPAKIQNRTAKAKFRFAVNPPSSDDTARETHQNPDSVARRSTRSLSPLFVPPQPRSVNPLSEANFQVKREEVSPVNSAAPVPSLKNEADVQVKREDLSPVNFAAAVPSEVNIKKEEDSIDSHNDKDDKRDLDSQGRALFAIKAELHELKEEVSKMFSRNLNPRSMKRSYSHDQTLTNNALMSGALQTLERKSKRPRRELEPPSAPRVMREPHQSRMLDSYRPQYLPLTRAHSPPRQIWLRTVGRQ